MTILERQEKRAPDFNHVCCHLCEPPGPGGLPAADDIRTMGLFTPERTVHMTKPLPKLPNTRIAHIPREELPQWARELDIDATGMDEATLRLRLKDECDRLFPIVHADFIKAYNEMLAEDGFPLAEWSYI